MNAAWRDKFRDKYYNENNTFDFQQNLADLKHSVDRAELAGTLPPQGYVNSFHGFLRYVSQEDDEKHLNAHWRSISLLCQPCRFVYNYILDIETAQDDSKFVFEELGFQARLPKGYQSSKTNKKSLADYFKGQGCSNYFPITTSGMSSQYYHTTTNFQYRPFHSILKRKELQTSIPETEIPKSLIKKIYAKYYLDFVLYGFSTDSVQAIVDVGIEETSNYSFKSKSGDEFAQYRKIMYKKQKRKLNPVQF